MSVCAFTLIR